MTLQRVPGYGFGIAVSGGRDNPHFTNGDPSIAISDVLKAGPAEGKLMINDRVISANNVSLEGVDYATAVQVLRDSGQMVNLVVKRRVVLPSPPEPQNIKVSLYKNKKKEDFGIVLGCKIYIKEITNRSVADKDGNLQEGDLIQKINNMSLDGLSLKEARKLLDSAKEKLDMMVKRDPYKSLTSNRTSPTQVKVENNQQVDDQRNNLASNQNLYVPPPSRKDEKNNLARADQLQKEETGDTGQPPPRPPLPKDEGLEGTPASEAGTLPMSEKKHDKPPSELALDLSGLQPNKTNDSADYGISPRRADDSSLSTSKNKGNLPDPRFISFQKEGSVGIRLTGGNDVGIFVTAVQPGSPAAQQGLQPGDKIIKVNDMDMNGVTREEAVLFLLSLQDQIDLIAQYRKDEYDQIVQLQRGDSFYIKAHFNYEQTEKGEMSFKKSDVFHVVDTLHNGVVGSWQAFRMDPFLSGLGRAAEQVQKGVIPNKSRAEEIATQQFNAAKKEQSVSENSKSSFFKRRKAQNHRRSKSLGKDHWEDLVWSESMSKFPAYERVSLRHPGFPRPVVIFGPVADIARERFLRDFPLKFASPQQDNAGEGSKSGIVRLSAIRDIMDRGRHALLDVTPNAVDKLNYAQFYPIVILARADSKQTIKDCRSGLPKKAHMSSKKLLEQCQKLEKLWGHVLTSTLPLHADNWYNKVTDLIEKQQTAPIWMSDTKPEESFSDDFLFPMTSRLSYTSAAESDGEFCGEDTPRRSAEINNSRNATSQDPSGRLVRATSDPSLARQDGTIKSEPGDHIPDYSLPPPYSTQPEIQQATATKRRSHGGDSKYGFPNKQNGGQQPAEEFPPPPQGSQAPPAKNGLSSGVFRGQSNDRYAPVPADTSPPDNKRSQSQPPNVINSKNKKEVGPNGTVPVLPPKIDRQKKPSKKSAAERLFGRSDDKDKGDDESPTNGDISDESPPENRNNGFKSMPPVTENNKKNTFDSNSSSNFDSYNKHSEPGYAYSRSISQPPQNGQPPNGNSHGYAGPTSGKFAQQPNGGPDKYRYSDYKPLPPPKSSIYKPVPPPKPKPFSRSNSQPPSMTESNYMNGNYINSGQQQESDYPQTMHYHSSRVTGIENGYAGTNGNGYPPSSPGAGYSPAGPNRVPNGHPVPQNGHSGPQSAPTGAPKGPPNGHPGPPNGHPGPPNGHPGPPNGHAGPPNGHPGPPNGHVNGHANGYDDIDSNGVDSGQGSSLDRDYSSYNGHTQYNGRDRYAPPPGGPPPGGPQRSSQGQYYYNLPNPRESQNDGGQNNNSPRRRAPGDTLDLSNREYRGSAFELYKKPGYSFPSYQDVPR